MMVDGDAWPLVLERLRGLVSESQDQEMVDLITYALRPTNVDFGPRCFRCHAKLAEYLTRPWKARCPKCKTIVARGRGRTR